jgi:hypothetical protein
MKWVLSAAVLCCFLQSCAGGERWRQLIGGKEHTYVFYEKELEQYMPRYSLTGETVYERENYTIEEVIRKQSEPNLTLYILKDKKNHLFTRLFTYTVDEGHCKFYPDDVGSGFMETKKKLQEFLDDPNFPGGHSMYVSESGMVKNTNDIFVNY